MSGFFIFQSCQSDKEEREYIAQVYNERLYKSDIPEDILEDEVKLDIYVNQWVERQILYYRARTDARIDQNEIQHQVDDFIGAELAEIFVEAVGKQLPQMPCERRAAVSGELQRLHGFALPLTASLRPKFTAPES